MTGFAETNDAGAASAITGGRVRSLLATVLLAGTALLSLPSYAQFDADACIVERGGNSCTANEGGAITATPVACASLTAGEIALNTNGCLTPAAPSCISGTTVPIKILVGLAQNNATRYDIGVYISTDANKPLNVAAPTGAATCGVTAVSIPPGSDSDLVNTCGDQPAQTALADSIELSTSIVCTAGTGGNLAVQLGASYQQSKGTATSCNFPGMTQVAPGTGSKCNTNTATVPIQVVTPAESVTLVKQLVPASDPGLFNLSIASPVPATPPSTATDVTEGGSVTRNDITPGTVVTLSETAGTGTSLSGYTSSLACVRTDNMDPVTVTNNTITMPTPEVGIVCTFTNTLNTGTVTVNKNFIPNSAAPVSVELSCTSGTVAQTPLNASESNAAVFTVNGFTPGATCTAIETVPTGYTADQTGCIGVAVDGSCTITNTRNDATFTVNKNFDPDNAGTVPVALNCTSGTVVQTPKNASEASPAVFTVNGFTVGATCTATETVPPGYVANQAGCIDVAVDGSCTITNTLNTSSVTVNKDFLPNSGASVSVALSCTSGTVASTPLNASEAAPAVFTVNGALAGATCTATETVPSGYVANQAGCASVPIGGSCTITNTLRTGNVTVIKDFTDGNTSSVSVGLSCTSGTVASTPLNASEASPAVFTVTGFNPGASCTATETVPPGYTSSQANCQGVSIGDSCTITNTPIVISEEVPVPTLSTWMLMLLGLMLAGTAWVTVRRR